MTSIPSPAPFDFEDAVKKRMLEIAVEKEAQRRLHEAKRLMKDKLLEDANVMRSKERAEIPPVDTNTADKEEFIKFAIEKNKPKARVVARKIMQPYERQVVIEHAAEKAAEAKAKAEALVAAAALQLEKDKSFAEWATAGFPIYTLCEMYCSWAMNPRPEIRPVGQWLPTHWGEYADLEEAFWDHMKSKGLACCSTCGKRPTVYRTYKPPPTCMDHAPSQKEVVGLWTANLGEVTTCGRHWIRNPHTGIGTIGDAFVLKPAKSGISLRCCENNINLDTWVPSTNKKTVTFVDDK